MVSATNNGRAQRRQLSDQLDRLDAILDGLSEALSESVADAVRGAVGQAVREAVEASIKEVLGSPELLRAALAAHGVPTAQPMPASTSRHEPTQPETRPSLKERIKGAVCGAAEAARTTASQAGKRLRAAWSWALNKLRAGCERFKDIGAACASAGKLAWQFRGPCAVAAAAGVLAGVGAYMAGPVIAGLACGLCGAASATAGMVLYPLWQVVRGADAQGA